MRVLLVGPDLESNLSLRYLASSLRAAGHPPRIATFDSCRDDAAVLRRGARTPSWSACRCASRCARPSSSTLAGRSRPTQPRRPDHRRRALRLLRRRPSCSTNHPALDVIVLHEGEQTIVELANLGAGWSRRRRRSPGVALRAGRARAPHAAAAHPRRTSTRCRAPDRSGPARLLAGVPTAYLMGSRGCVNALRLLLHHHAAPPRPRARASASARPRTWRDEMAGALPPAAACGSSSSTTTTSWCPTTRTTTRASSALDAARCSRHRVKDIALVLKCSPHDADQRILARLQEMGLMRIFMGIESGTPVRARRHRPHARRWPRPSGRWASARSSASRSQYTLIIFHPEATPESMLADLDFVGAAPGAPAQLLPRRDLRGHAARAAHARRRARRGRLPGPHLPLHRPARRARSGRSGSDLFAGRCWGQDELLGQAIRLDHQVTVLRHFYEGRRRSSSWCARSASGRSS